MYNYLKTRSIYQFIGLVLLCITSTVDAQNTIRGRVTDAENKPVPYINVMAQSINKGAVTDADGAFMISNIAPGNYEITVSGIGFETQTLTSSVPGPALTVTLNEKDHELDEIVIQGKSDTQLAIEQPFKTEVINTKALAHQPSTMIELMNRSVGVRVRQTGGLGSSASISVNGFQDNAIKYFKDGIPMDYLGAGFNFAFVPVNMLERLEIYKGVLPVSLGADALGGALNLVTKEPSRKYVEASYELASYNTHRASLNLFTGNPERKYFIGTNAFFNYSDNNYEVLAPVVNEQTSNKEPTEVRLFHAAFKQYYGEVYGGLKNTRWADELRFSLTGFWIHRDNQYGSQLITPIGQAFSRQYSVVPTVRYRKRFLDNRLSVDQFLVANTLHVETVDTARGTYDWYGNFRPRWTLW